MLKEVKFLLIELSKPVKITYLHKSNQCNYKKICAMLSLFTEFKKEFESN